MHNGPAVDHEIHMKLLEEDKCLVCLTYENFTSPWLQYEAGVVLGANAHKSNKE